MADLAKITLPSGNVYNFKDTAARQDIEILQNIVTGAMHYIGETTTAIQNGDSTNPVIIDGKSVTAKSGDVVIYQSKEYVFSDTDDKWHEFGSTGSLKALAFKDAASGQYTPSGSVSKPTFTGNELTSSGKFTPSGSVSTPTITVVPNTTNVKEATGKTMAKAVVATAPGATAPDNPVVYYSVHGETLSLFQLGFETEDSITLKDVSVVNGIKSATSSQLTFTGTEDDVTVKGTPTGDVSKPTFTGNQETITVS